MIKMFIFAVYLFVALFGLYKLKASEFGINPDFIAGVFFYGSSFLIWLVLIRWFPLSIIFPLAAGSLIVGTQIIGATLLDEKFDIYSGLAIGLILSGLCALAYLSYDRGQI